MIVKPEEILFTDKGGGVSQRMLGYRQPLMAVEMTFAKGSEVSPHSHPDHLQGIYIVKGSFEITCGGETSIMKAGDMCFADKGEIHSTLCLEDQSILLDIHTPMREDILKEGLDYNSQFK
ncbi:cupin domain-containing protein [Clostridium sp. AM58-1XD]|uniref:cupin domain-containing protein n=1 Tax=Clostridium sp. AM58-1XD TaxID=2292307 RepID=UPI000E482818|nr:cupin domain-containing protein [Clostridium sp. AM58-1XD]RGY99834.1 cupin domain-containing protein [Clostridium sp. AM58-1XD]